MTDIKRSVKKFQSTGCDNLFTVTKANKNPYFNQVEYKGKNLQIVKKSKKRINTRQAAPNVYDMNASIYIWRRNKILNTDNLYGGKTDIYIMPFERSLDIDEEDDWRTTLKAYQRVGLLGPTEYLYRGAEGISYGQNPLIAAVGTGGPILGDLIGMALYDRGFTETVARKLPLRGTKNI